MTAPASVSAIWPLNVAIAAAIEAARADDTSVLGSPLDDGGPIVLDAPAVYSGQVPVGTPLTSAYIVLGMSQEVTSPGVFRRRGKANVETLDVWTSDRSKRTAVIVAGALLALLDGAALALEGYGTVRGRCETVLTIQDPSTRQYRAQLRYTAKSFNPIPAP